MRGVEEKMALLRMELPIETNQTAIGFVQDQDVASNFEITHLPSRSSLLSHESFQRGGTPVFVNCLCT
jgi:hypothetical protein